MDNKEIKKILIVEDDQGLQKQLKWCFEGFEIFIAGDRASALSYIENHTIPVVTLDLGLPPDAEGATEGLATLEEILKLAPHTKVIMVTGNHDRESAVKAVALGAYDFYEKPIDSEILRLIVERAYRLYQLEAENRKLLKQKDSTPLPGIMAGSSEMLKVCRQIEKIAPVDVTTLLFGESGTGKELLAKALHQLSSRAEQRFVAINCAAIPDNLLESELFGFEKGAFTGATKRTIGKIEHANHGTLLLDEIGDLPPALQSKLLRFLQERVIERLGGREEVPVDVRIISASHRDLKALIAKGEFREDLYYRLSEVTITVPPLRERPGDAVAIANMLMGEFEVEQGRTLPKLSQDAILGIESYDWPGNIRELQNRLKRAAVLSDGEEITAEDLELVSNEMSAELLKLSTVRDEAELQALTRALSMNNGNISKAAKVLGVSRPTLYDLMNKHGLK